MVIRTSEERSSKKKLRGVSWFDSPAASYNTVQVKLTGRNSRTGETEHMHFCKKIY